MGAVFAIRRSGQTSFHSGPERLSSVIFARGPGYATTIARDCPAIHEAAGSASALVRAAGFLLDHDVREALWYDASVRFDVEDDGLPHGTMSLVPLLAELDLYEDEERVLREALSEGVSAERWIAALQRMPLADSWRDWNVQHVSRASFEQAISRWSTFAPKVLPDFFPVGAFSDTPFVDEATRGMYGGALSRAGEPSLAGALDPDVHVLRLLVLPHRWICRITKRRDAVDLDVFVERPSSALRTRAPSARAPTRSLRQGTWREATKLLERSDFWKLPTLGGRQGHDGETWMLEAAIEGRYHVVVRWCPELGDDVWELSRFLERFGGWRLR
ncbi:MAG: hypothetical protein H6721_27445 [Sandaracinus sp.]|nr:hypothetical protein [Sandaracinus sp.]